MLGHRNIRNTSIYTQLVDFGSDEHYSATANTFEEARKLIEAGFTYVCDMDVQTVQQEEMKNHA